MKHLDEHLYFSKDKLILRLPHFKITTLNPLLWHFIFQIKKL